MLAEKNGYLEKAFDVLNSVYFAGKLAAVSPLGSLISYQTAVAVVLIAFAVVPQLWMLVVATIALGVADSFGLAMLSHYFTEIPSVNRIGASEAMTTVTLSGKAGQFIAPQLFAITQGSPLLMGIITAIGGVTYSITGRGNIWRSEG